MAAPYSGSERVSVGCCALLCRIRLYGVKGAGFAGARPAGGTSGAVLGRRLAGVVLRRAPWTHSESDRIPITPSPLDEAVIFRQWPGDAVVRGARSRPRTGRPHKR